MTTVNPINDLFSIRKQIMTTLIESGIQDKDLLNFLNNSVRELDSYVGSSLKASLTKEFGQKEWTITMDTFVRPILTKSLNDKNKDYKYVIKNISWRAGPSPIQVHYFIAENFRYNLSDDKYNSALYTRHIPDIEKRHTPDIKKGYLAMYKPYPINNQNFRSIEIFILKVQHKINSKEMKQYYQIEVKDRNLGIIRDSSPITEDNIASFRVKSNTFEEGLTAIQTRLEEIYYIRSNTPENRIQYKSLMKYAMSHTAMPVEHPSKAEKDAEQAKEGEEMFKPGEEVADVDTPDVFSDDSIPIEEPLVDENDGGVPPTEEFIDHDFHNDEKPEFEEEAEKESGDESEKEETAGNEEMKLNDGLGHSISEMIIFDKFLESEKTISYP